MEKSPSLLRQKRGEKQLKRLINILILIIVVLSTLSSAEVRPELPLHRLEVEFSKGQIYPGEQVRCDFVLYTRFPALEVEVAKFPEFRGYWKTNTLLRQGPVQASYSVHGTLWNRILIGSYELVAMVDDKAPELEPMKLVVRRPDGTRLGYQVEERLLSKILRPLKLLPFPKAPRDSEFTGAVGEFFIRPLRSEISFQPDEPTVLRVWVEGNGNFQEINRLPLSFPSHVKVLAQNSDAPGSFPFQSKVFEWTLLVSGKEAFSFPGPKLVYFNPELRTYRIAEAGPVRFQPMVSEKLPQVPPPSFTLGPARETPSLTTSWQNSPWFWIAQSTILMVFWFAFQSRRKRKPSPIMVAAKGPSRKDRAREARTAYEDQNYEKFLTLAEDLALEVLRQRSPQPLPGESRTVVLRRVETLVSPELLGHARALFSARDALCYAPTPTPPSDPKSLLNALEQLLAA